MKRMRTGPVLAPMEDVPEVVTLRPGRVHFATAPAVVSTVLGSCVAVTMHCSRVGAGAICHALFPGGVPAGGDEAYRYVDRSVEAMVAWFARIGAGRGEIEVKLFGGAGADWGAAGGPAPVDVGRSNVESALRTLGACGLRVAARDVGGTIGRKLYFLPHTGDVYMKRLVNGTALGGPAPARGFAPEECP